MNYLRKSIIIINTVGKIKNNVSLFTNNFLKNCSTSTSYDVSLNVNGINVGKYVKNLEVEYETLSLGRNHSTNSRWLELHPIMQILKERNEFVEHITNLKELLEENDADMKKLAEHEREQLKSKIKEIDEKLLEVLVPLDEEDLCAAIVLEVQAGVGGKEAMLFAKEVFDMYCNFAEYKGWELQLANYQATELGGVRHATALISGRSTFRYFKHEAGIHRVQRTPTTEKAGRVHTSTISVIARPQPADIEVNVNPKDLKIETKRSTGAGGQHVNTTDSAVRIVHLPTGVAVECQVDRSQIKNKKMALAQLSAILYQRELDARNAATDALRKSQVTTRNRNDKIRTYNFNQDRITDHRLGVNVHNLKTFFEGGEPLENLIRQIDEHRRIERLLNIVNNSV